MIKGVNRQVLEIAQPECAYFERVLFFVKPEYSSVSENKLKDKADLLIKNSSAPPYEKRVGQASTKIKRFLQMLLAAGAGAAAAGIIAFLS